jgi:hemerythrin-like domain-containing protein
LSDALDLDRRDGWPAELLFLLERHPRDGWPGRPDLGMTARFWLDRHGTFRQLGQALQDDTEAFRQGRIAAEDFQVPFIRRLQVFLGELHGHHQVEDHHYFPVFRRAEPRLARGFEVLDRDHQTLHAGLVATAEAANALLQALARDPEAAQGPAEAYAEVSTTLLRRMLRHLDDEEDLVIPLMLERGEAALAP